MSTSTSTVNNNDHNQHHHRPELLAKDSLVSRCIEVASRNMLSVEKWRRQKRTLAKLPIHLGEALFKRLRHRRLVNPGLLEVFQFCIEEITLSGETTVDAEWMAYVGGFRYLCTLNVADCRSIDNSALWSLTGMDTLKELDLSRCLKVTDASIGHLLTIRNLEKLHLSETGLSASGVAQLCLLKKLYLLDLGGLPVTDLVLNSLQVLTKLNYLDLWGSEVSNEGVKVLKHFPKLSYLNLAWTNVTKLPVLPSLTCLNMSRCIINSLFEEESKANSPQLEKLLIPGATFPNVHDTFSFIDLTRLLFLDMSNSSYDDFWFLTKLDVVEHLDLSYSKIGDDSIEMVASIGANVKLLNLSNTRVSNDSIGVIAVKFPNIRTLLLSHTAIDDLALPYIGLMPFLRVIDLSNTSIKGVTGLAQDESNHVLSLTALENLSHLERLNLEETRLEDEALQPLSRIQGLKTLSLRSNFLTDNSLITLSYLTALKLLSLCGAILTDFGLLSFMAPPMLEVLDLRDCWLLTDKAILEFCQKYPNIEVRHELAKDCFINHSSLIHGDVANSQRRSKITKLPLIPNRIQIESFADERLQYSRNALLELQFSPLSEISSNIMNVLPKILTE